jgi:hypothetical protein
MSRVNVAEGALVNATPVAPSAGVVAETAGAGGGVEAVVNDQLVEGESGTPSGAVTPVPIVAV